ncbi:MAG: peptidase S41 [Gammaproteobacteria bacterium]|nr:peptidase S41 [Gammaproteobacteria bacterium]
MNAARDAYLFLDLLPANVDMSSYATAAELLDALTATAREQNKDRHFSYLTTPAAEQQFFSDGASVGFGISLSKRDTDHLYVTQVFGGSAASDAGFLRGDEIMAIGTDATNLVSVAMLIAANELNNALGPAQAGVQRTIRVQVPQSADPVDRTLIKRSYSVDPVPEYKIIERVGLTPVGYVNLRSFISPSEAPLRAAFRAFKAAYVNDIIIDVRYNGGGLVSIAETLAKLMSPGRSGQPMYSVRFNSRHSNEQRTVLFTDDADAVAGVNIAFIATVATASASELVINILEPYANIAIVGATTYGKPVGQYPFDQTGCDVRLRLITFKHVNRDNEGDFFDGLPNTAFSGKFCAASDDITNPQGDVAEASVATALHWVNNNACPATALRSTTGLLTKRSDAEYPMPEQPTLTQIHMPGTY